MTTIMNRADMQALLHSDSPLDYRKTSRLLREMEDDAALRVALMGNVTLDLVAPYLRVEAARVGHMARFHVSPFGQYRQALHGPDLAAFDPDVLLLVLTADGLRPDAMEDFHRLPVADRHALRDEMIGEIAAWIDLALAGTRASLMIANFPLPHSALGLADLSSDYGEREFFLDLNLALLRTVRAHPRATILDLAGAVQRIGTQQAYDRRLHYMAGLGWTETMMRGCGELFAHGLVGTLGSARKCLVLDLDNSLWGGVVGEDGPHGVRVGRGDMVSEAFRAFQLRIRALRERGIILALCSKNNPEDVEEIFRLRSDMPLQMSDMAATAIGWDAKYLGLENIAKQLNIGLDALVFMDDNAMEIAAVRQYCPDVQAIQLPPDPSDYAALLDTLPWFEKGRLTQEDRDKGEQYATAARREALRATSDPLDYLRDLDMRAAIRTAGPADLLRVHQLLGKTNQFNLTTQRPGMGEVEAYMAAPDSDMIVADLRDRFGDLGTVAICGISRADGRMRIDHFLMSCRAMGRGLEHALMNEVKRRFLATPHCDELVGAYRPTAKNRPVREFYTEQGFAPFAGGQPGDHLLVKTDARPMDCGWILLECE